MSKECTQARHVVVLTFVILATVIVILANI